MGGFAVCPPEATPVKKLDVEVVHHGHDEDVHLTAVVVVCRSKDVQDSLPMPQKKRQPSVQVIGVLHPKCMHLGQESTQCTRAGPVPTIQGEKTTRCRVLQHRTQIVTSGGAPCTWHFRVSLYHFSILSLGDISVPCRLQPFHAALPNFVVLNALSDNGSLLTIRTLWLQCPAVSSACCTSAKTYRCSILAGNSLYGIAGTSQPNNGFA